MKVNEVINYTPEADETKTFYIDLLNNEQGDPCIEQLWVEVVNNNTGAGYGASVYGTMADVSLDDTFFASHPLAGITLNTKMVVLVRATDGLLSFDVTGLRKLKIVYHGIAGSHLIVKEIY